MPSALGVPFHARPWRAPSATTIATNATISGVRRRDEGEPGGLTHTRRTNDAALRHRAGARRQCGRRFCSALRWACNLAARGRAEAEVLGRLLRREADVGIAVLAREPRQLPPHVVANRRPERVAAGHGRRRVGPSDRGELRRAARRTRAPAGSHRMALFCGVTRQHAKAGQPIWRADRSRRRTTGPRRRTAVRRASTPTPRRARHVRRPLRAPRRVQRFASVTGPLDGQPAEARIAPAEGVG